MFIKLCLQLHYVSLYAWNNMQREEMGWESHGNGNKHGRGMEMGMGMGMALWEWEGMGV